MFSMLLGWHGGRHVKHVVNAEPLRAETRHETRETCNKVGRGLCTCCVEVWALALAVLSIYRTKIYATHVYGYML